jgi:hypothetical protein
LAAIDAMRVDDDPALRRLTKHLGQAGHGMNDWIAFLEPERAKSLNAPPCAIVKLSECLLAKCSGPLPGSGPGGAGFSDASSDVSDSPGGPVDDAAEVAAVEMRLLVRDDVGLDVAEGPYPACA